MSLRSFSLLGLQLVVCCALAQESLQTPESRAEERQRLESKQHELDVTFDARDAECKTRFAVTPCRNQVRLERIRAQDEIKRKISALNRLDRQAAAAKQQRKLDEKMR